MGAMILQSPVAEQSQMTPRSAGQEVLWIHRWRGDRLFKACESLER
jgi:hypothetical protein